MKWIVKANQFLTVYYRPPTVLIAVFNSRGGMEDDENTNSRLSLAYICAKKAF